VTLGLPLFVPGAGADGPPGPAGPAIPPTTVFHNAALANDAVPVVIGAIDVSALRTFFIIQTFVLRDAAGRMFTSQRRISITGGAVPVIQVDFLVNQASNLTALPVIANSIVGTNFTLTMTITLLGNTVDVTVYSTIYEGLGSP
jgi:hypothetical protein